jgi:hypothetical protein
MFKMSSHDPFGYLKKKLWLKERLVVKLWIWFLTIKSQEFPWFTCVQVVCHILLKKSWQGLQLLFTLCLNQRYAQKVMGLQNCRSFNFRHFGTPNLGVSEQNDIMGAGLVATHIIHYKGEGGGFSQVPTMVSFMNLCLPVLHLCTKSARTTH